MTFRGVLVLNGKTATGIRVPAEIVIGLGSSKRPAVRITLRDYAYRSTIAPMGGEFWIPVSADVRSKAGVAAGDEVDVQLELDTEPREVTVPDDLLAALQSSGPARAFFDGLSYSNKLRHVLSIDGAKTPETRDRRIAQSVEMFAAGKS